MIYSVNSRILSLFGLLICFSIACSQNSDPVAEVHTSELPQLELDHQFSISDSEELFFQHIIGVISDSEGRIYLPDQRALQIHVFDSDGTYVTSIGGSGAGPGEFQSLLNVYIDQHDQLMAYDIRQSRNTIFVEESDSWEPEQIFMVEGNRYGIESADADGNVIVRTSSSQYPEPGAFWYEHELATANLATGLQEENVLTFKERGNLVTDNRFMSGIPFGRTTNFASDVEGNVYLVWNEQFELAIYNAQLEWTDSLSVPIPNQPISEEERIEAIDRLGDNFKSLGREHMPETKPVISNLVVDRNRNLWVQTYDSPEYLVIDQEGTPLKSFDLEDGLQLAHVDENRLYALQVSDEGYQIHVYDYQL